MGTDKKMENSMLKFFAVLGLAGILTLAAVSSFAQSHWNGYRCIPPQYDDSGAPVGPYCPD
jgi:hypothetical protein